jgi:hypothetical protein
LRRAEWLVYSKRPPELSSKGGGPEAVLAYLSRYTHRVAISNSRLIGITSTSVTFKWKDYRAHGGERAKTMTLAIDEFNAPARPVAAVSLSAAPPAVTTFTPQPTACGPQIPIVPARRRRTTAARGFLP